MDNKFDKYKKKKDSYQQLVSIKVYRQQQKKKINQN